MSFDNTIKLVSLQRATLVQAIQSIDDHFYARVQPKEILRLIKKDMGEIKKAAK